MPVQPTMNAVTKLAGGKGSTGRSGADADRGAIAVHRPVSQAPAPGRGVPIRRTVCCVTAELIARIRAGLDADEAWAQRFETLLMQVHLRRADTREHQAAVAAFMFVQDDTPAAPDRILDRVAADRAILEEVAGWRHTSCADGYYSCSQATEEAGYPIDEACGDDERRGQPCDCGLERRRAAILGPLAEAYGVDGGPQDPARCKCPGSCCASE